MTVYYADFTNGLDANNGLGPDASHGTNRPWKTLTKTLGAAGIASGDTVYLAPGSFREVVTVAMTSATGETFVLGDPSNSQGFKTSGGVLVAPADVIWSAYLTNDTSAPSASNLLALAARDFLTFQNIVFSTGSAASVFAAAGSTDIKFLDCAFFSPALIGHFGITGVADAALNWTISRCAFISMNANAILVTMPTSASADYDVNVQITNCLFLQLGTAAISVTASGVASFKGGGVDVLNCTLFGTNTSSLLQTNSANVATSIPCTAYNNLIWNATGASLNANAAGQILEDYNRLVGSSTRTNVTPGANSITGNNQAPLIEIGQAFLNGRMPRPFGMPLPGSPILGFGSTGSPPTVDIMNRPRPAGGASILNAVGAYERHDTAVQETSVVQAGSSAIKIIGPGDHQFQIPVDAVSTVISIYTRYDTNHGTGTKPQAILLANGAIGVVTETKTATVGVDTWEQLTFAAQTPSAKGVVTIRLISRAAAGNGIAYFDTAAVA